MEGLEPSTWILVQFVQNAFPIKLQIKSPSAYKVLHFGVDYSMETILHNPWIYLWKWDTMLDKIFEKVKTEWLYDKVKDQLKKDLVFELNINNKNN